MKKVIVIIGPTGVGKSSLAVKIAQKINTEIISGDSVQVYKALNIGSAKIKKEEMNGIPHHLIDIKSLSESYSVFDFQKEARKLIDMISEKGEVPIIVGGTGFYIKAALFDYDFKSEKRTNEFDSLSNAELYERLQNLSDPELPDINNRKRLLRHLEIYRKGNTPEKRKDTPLYDILFIGLTMEREKLYEKINDRVDKMIDEGLIEEVKSLYQDNKSGILFEAIGYKEICMYLNNELPLNEAIEKIKKDTRNFAKRQYTWFNNQMEVNWIDVSVNDSFNESMKLVNLFLKK